MRHVPTPDPCILCGVSRRVARLPPAHEAGVVVVEAVVTGSATPGVAP